jgi:hypothetical protein
MKHTAIMIIVIKFDILVDVLDEIESEDVEGEVDGRGEFVGEGFVGGMNPGQY